VSKANEETEVIKIHKNPTKLQFLLSLKLIIRGGGIIITCQSKRMKMKKQMTNIVRGALMSFMILISMMCFSGCSSSDNPLSKLLKINNIKDITIVDYSNYKVDFRITDLSGDDVSINITTNNPKLTITPNFKNPLVQADYTDTNLSFNVTSDYNVASFDKPAVVQVTINLKSGSASKSASFNVNIQKAIKFRGLTYGVVTSPHTNRVWLDRNLGAKKVCEKVFRDDECLGGLYQWGREADGHEKIDSVATTTQATDLDATNVAGKFVTGARDWLASGIDDNGSIRSANWAKTDGSSICPAGFRVPTVSEIKSEFDRLPKIADTGTVSDPDPDAVGFLKIASTTWRNRQGWLDISVVMIRFWTTEAEIVIGLSGYYVSFRRNGDVVSDTQPAVFGMSVRCIKAP